MVDKTCEDVFNFPKANTEHGTVDLLANQYNVNRLLIPNSDSNSASKTGIIPEI